MKPTAVVRDVKPVLRGALALSALALALAATEARASTAANTTITNTATVTYNDGGGAAQAPVSASASVTVTLVPSAVVLSSPPDVTVPQSTVGQTLSYTITATANGPDTYNLSANVVPANVTGGSVTPPANIVLGGTTLAVDAVAGNPSITVPYDGANDGVVNGIAVGDTVVVGANAYQVTNVVENAAGNTATLTVGGGIAGANVAAGAIVGERATFTALIVTGTVDAGGSGTLTVTTTATGATAPNPATSQATPTLITITRPTLLLAKTFSTNPDADNTGYAAAGNAAPGTSLIYKIVATNNGAGAANLVNITDLIPAYLTYVPGSGRTAADVDTTYNAAAAVTDGADADGYQFAAGSVTYATASVASGATLVVFFRATIN